MQMHPHQLLTFDPFCNNTTPRALEIRLWNQDWKGTTLVYCCFHPWLLKKIRLGGLKQTVHSGGG